MHSNSERCLTDAKYNIKEQENLIRNKVKCAEKLNISLLYGRQSLHKLRRGVRQCVST